MSDLVTMVPCVDALDLPSEVEDWCCDNDISTHYVSELHQVDDDGNVFAEWLKEQGIEFGERSSMWVGVIGT